MSWLNRSFLKCGRPWIINFNRIFHYKPSILGYPHLSKPPNPSKSVPIHIHHIFMTWKVLASKISGHLVSFFEYSEFFDHFKCSRYGDGPHPCKKCNRCFAWSGLGVSYGCVWRFWGKPAIICWFNSSTFHLILTLPFFHDIHVFIIFRYTLYKLVWQAYPHCIPVFFPTSLCGVLVFGCPLPPSPSVLPPPPPPPASSRLLLLPSACNLSTHNLLTHNLLTHNLLIHNLCTHNLSTHNLSTHNLLTHNLLTHNLYHTTCSHTTCSYTTCPHTTCSHTTCTHTHNLSTHNLLTHNFPTDNLLTQLVHTQLAHTQFVHTQLVHTQLAHTQLDPTQLTHTQLVPHNLLTHNLLIHNLPTHNLLTHNLYTHTTCPHTTRSHTASPQTTCSHNLYTHTQLAHTQFVHTQFVHTQLAHTQLDPTQLTHTQLTPRLFAWQAWRLATSQLHFAWQAWHLETSTVTLRGRRGTYGTHHLWHTIFHTTLSHTIFHTPSQTIFHTPLCHTPSFLHLSFLPRPRYNICCSLSLLEEVDLWGYPVL